jgi:hypothetical protein
MRRDTVYCPTHSIVEDAVIDRARPVRFVPPTPADKAIVAKALLKCGSQVLVVTPPELWKAP